MFSVNFNQKDCCSYPKAGVSLCESEEEDELYDIYDYVGGRELDEKLYDMTYGFSIKSIIKGLIEGDLDYVKDCIIKGIDISFRSQMKENRELMAALISVILMGALFINISDSFGKTYVSENGFYVTYIISTSLMLTAFLGALEIAGNAINSVLEFINILLPVYYLSMNYLGYAGSALSAYKMILAGIWIIEVVILRIVLPLIKFYVIVVFLNNFDKEDRFSKLAKLIKTVVKWMLRSAVLLVLGLNLIKGLINPGIDVISRTTFNKVISFIPGGNYVNAMTTSFLAAGVVVKNCIGVGGIVAICFILLVPLVKTIVFVFASKITGALVQPLGDKRYVNGIDGLSEGLILLCNACFSSALLFMLTLAIMSYATKAG